MNELTAACVCVCVEEGEPAVNQKANDSVGEGVRSRSRSHTGDLPWRSGGYWTLLVLGDTTVQWLWVWIPGLGPFCADVLPVSAWVLWLLSRSRNMHLKKTGNLKVAEMVVCLSMSLCDKSTHLFNMTAGIATPYPPTAHDPECRRIRKRKWMNELEGWFTNWAPVCCCLLSVNDFHTVLLTCTWPPVEGVDLALHIRLHQPAGVGRCRVRTSEEGRVKNGAAALMSAAARRLIVVDLRRVCAHANRLWSWRGGGGALKVIWIFIAAFRSR